MPAQIHILWTDSFPAPVVSKVQFNQRLQFHQLFREAFQVIFLTQSVHLSEGGCWPRGIRRRKPITCWTKGWLRELFQRAESSTVQSGITATKNQEYHKNMIRGSSRSKTSKTMYYDVCICMYMYSYISCIHILAWYRKNITLYLSTLFGQPCYQPRRWKIQSLELLELSSVAFQNISKICSKVAPPPLFLWHSAWFHVPRMLSRNPRRMKAVAIRNALLWNGGDARVSAGRKVQKSSHSEALRKTGMKCHLQEKNIILDKFWQPGWNFIVSCNGLCYEVVPDKEACESWSDRTKLLDIPSPIPCWVVPLHAPIPSYWTSVQKKCWTNKKYPSIRVPFSFSHLLDKILHSRQATPASLWTEGPQVCGA